MPHLKNILIVDDNNEHLIVFSSFLELLNYNVLSAPNAVNAMEILKIYPVDLVITDYHMPEYTGAELLKVIKKYHPQLPVVIMTGLPSVESSIECMKSGADDYLTKPLDPEKIKSVIERVFQRQSLSAEQSLEVTSPNSETPTFLGGYLIVKLIGVGGHGSVYLAEKDGRHYALKVLKPDKATDYSYGTYRERFIREATVCKDISHANIVRIIDCGMTDNEIVPYLVMDYVPGNTLSYYIHEAPEAIGFERKVQIIRDLASALSAIHAHKIYHRDIKPENIIIDEHLNPRLTDFGIVKLPDSNLTLCDEVMGTPHYMAPEGFVISEIDGRADIFSLGVIAYQWLLGQRPFEGRNLTMLIFNITNQKPNEPRMIKIDFPYDLQAILAKMLQKDRESRYQSANDLVADLDDYLNHKPLPHLTSFNLSTWNVVDLYEPTQAMAAITKTDDATEI